ncbi:hypothetical protein, partial [Litorimonas sp.]|uniref:hypothetical protein n=1 Tax=Litorimonas sp. TaxID=1892381 RepID=UPI003A89879E
MLTLGDFVTVSKRKLGSFKTGGRDMGGAATTGGGTLINPAEKVGSSYAVVASIGVEKKGRVDVVEEVTATQKTVETKVPEKKNKTSDDGQGAWKKASGKKKSNAPYDGQGAWEKVSAKKKSKAPYKRCSYEEGAWLEEEEPTRTLEDQTNEVPVHQDQVVDGNTLLKTLVQIPTEAGKLAYVRTFAGVPKAGYNQAKARVQQPTVKRGFVGGVSTGEVNTQQTGSTHSVQPSEVEGNSIIQSLEDEKMCFIQPSFLAEEMISTWNSSEKSKDYIPAQGIIPAEETISTSDLSNESSWNSSNKSKDNTPAQGITPDEETISTSDLSNDTNADTNVPLYPVCKLEINSEPEPVEPKEIIPADQMMLAEEISPTWNLSEKSKDYTPAKDIIPAEEKITSIWNLSNKSKDHSKIGSFASVELATVDKIEESKKTKTNKLSLKKLFKSKKPKDKKVDLVHRVVQFQRQSPRVKNENKREKESRRQARKVARELIDRLFHTVVITAKEEDTVKASSKKRKVSKSAALKRTAKKLKKRQAGLSRPLKITEDKPKAMLLMAVPLTVRNVRHETPQARKLRLKRVIRRWKKLLTAGRLLKVATFATRRLALLLEAENLLKNVGDDQELFLRGGSDGIEMPTQTQGDLALFLDFDRLINSLQLKSVNAALKTLNLKCPRKGSKSGVLRTHFVTSSADKRVEILNILRKLLDQAKKERLNNSILQPTRSGDVVPSLAESSLMTELRFENGGENICYINSTLNVVLNLQPLTAILEQDGWTDKLAFTLGDHISELRSLLNKGHGDTTNALEVRRRVSRDSKYDFSRGDPEDVVQFFMAFENILIREFAEPYQDELKDIFRGKYTVDRVCKKCGISDSVLEDMGPVVPIPLKDGQTLANSFRSVLWNGDLIRNCQIENCNGKSCTEHKRLSSFPSVLVLHLQRFKQVAQNCFVKDESPVHVEKVITLNNQRYHLHSFIKHIGSKETGHYICSVFNKSASTYTQFSDLNINKGISE